MKMTIKMPRVGETVDEVYLVDWNKSVGDVVAVGVRETDRLRDDQVAGGFDAHAAVGHDEEQFERCGAGVVNDDIAGRVRRQRESADCRVEREGG